MNTATPAQIQYIETLKADRVISADDAKVVDAFREAWNAQAFTKVMASSMIDWLRTLPRTAREVTPVADAPEGMHKVGDAIFKVQRAVHGSGNLYAKRLVVAERECPGHLDMTDSSAFDAPFVYCAPDADCANRLPARVTFEYAKGVIRNLSEATLMSLDEAKAFGALYGTCCVCGRTLTDEGSIEAGIGPVCAKRF